MQDPAPLEILLVDDDAGHTELVRRSLRRNGLTNAITAVNSGDSAMDYLFGRGHWHGRAPGGPLLVLLDLKMPGAVDGGDVLRLAKADARTRHIPIIVLTTTNDPREVNRCYDLGCSAYLAKPVEPERFAETVRRLGQFLDVLSAPTLEGATS